MRDEGWRQAAYAGSFYPSAVDELNAFLNQVTLEPCSVDFSRPIAAILPHAGWVYSGAPAARALQLLAKRCEKIETLVLFGAVHRIRMAEAPCLDWHSSWETPLGRIEVDREAAETLSSNGAVVESPLCHQGEHSLEVLIPMVQTFLPGTRILPLAMVPTLTAHEAGAAIARVMKELGRKVAVIGSTDLTHYGPRFGLETAGLGEEGLAWARSNDQRFLNLLANIKEKELVPEAQRQMNACGAGAAAGALGFAREMGADKALILEHTDSHQASGKQNFDGTYVGYGSAIFGQHP